MVSATNYERANLLRVGNLRTYEHISIYDEFKESVIVSILLPPRNRDLVTKGCLHRILRWAGVVWRRGDVSGIHCLSPTSTTPEATRHQATRGEEQNYILQTIFRHTYHAMPILYNAMQWHAIPYNTMQHQATRGEDQNNILQNIFNVLMSSSIKCSKLEKVA